MLLPPGTLLDRFGGETGLSTSAIDSVEINTLLIFTGTYLSAADAPYSQRSLPPSNLNDNSYYPGFPYNYHVYRVKKELEVTGGPIAPVCLSVYFQIVSVS